MNCRVLLSKNGTITNSFQNHNGWAKGIDVVKTPGNLDYIVSHSDGKVIKTMIGQVNGKNDNEGFGYGNYVMIAHNDGYVTVYGHLERVLVSMGMLVSEGQEIGFMGNTGNSYGAHLHFEVRKYNVNPLTLDPSKLQSKSYFEFVNPTSYLDADLPTKPMQTIRVQVGAYKFKLFAKNMVNKLIKDGYKPIVKMYKDGLIHVQTGAFNNPKYAEKMADELKAKGYPVYLTTEDGQDITL